MTRGTERKAQRANLVVHGVHVEVVARMPAGYSPHRNPVSPQSEVEEQVNRNGVLECPESVREDFAWLSDVIADLERLYAPRVVIAVTEAVSLAGMYKALRHRLRSYPAFIVNRKEVVAGRDRERLLRIVDAHLRNSAAS